MFQSYFELHIRAFNSLFLGNCLFTLSGYNGEMLKSILFKSNTTFLTNHFSFSIIATLKLMHQLLTQSYLLLSSLSSECFTYKAFW